MKNNHYVYRITNTKLNKHYYGTRSSCIEPIKDLGIKYYSSSTDMSFRTDQKNNPQNYKYTIVSVFYTRDEAILYEVMLHDKFNVGVNESFYNKVKQTSIGFDVTGTKHDSAAKQKMSDAATNKRSGSNNSFYGKKHTIEWKENATKHRTGTVYEKVACPHCDVVGGINVMKMHHFEKCGDKSNAIKRAKQITCPHCDKTGGAAGMWGHHFNNCKKKQS